MSGCVADIDVWEEDFIYFYVVYVFGGFWKMENNGFFFMFLFEKEVVMMIGDIVVDWKIGIIWVGMGEVNVSCFFYVGIGIYKSIDEGKIWIYFGLLEIYYIGCIFLYFDDLNIVWVVVFGYFYFFNFEWGFYKIIDGGKFWDCIFYVGLEIGVVDFIMELDNFNIFYVVIW